MNKIISMNGRFKERKWMSEWQTREHSCEHGVREKGSQWSTGLKGKGQCAKVPESEKTAYNANLLKRAIWNGIELEHYKKGHSASHSPDTHRHWCEHWPLAHFHAPQEQSSTIHRSFYWHWLAFQLRGVHRALAMLQAGTQFCTSIIQLHKEVSQEEQCARLKETCSLSPRCPHILWHKGETCAGKGAKDRLNSCRSHFVCRWQLCVYADTILVVHWIVVQGSTKLLTTPTLNVHN